MAPLLINISRRQAFIYAIFLVAYEFLTYIANDMIMPGMLKVVTSFHAPESDIATSLTAYVLGGASLQLFLGPISDRHGRRPVMLFGAVFFFVCTVIIACSNSMDQFLIARFFQGMGLCFIGVVGYATLQEIFSDMDAIRLIAIMANVSVLAPLIGPLWGAVFIYYYSWRIIFVMISILAFIVIGGLWWFMPESVGQSIKDGETKKPQDLSIRNALENYRQLITNRSFILGSAALGVIYLPCMAWIALSPVILVKSAHLTLIEYSLWQIPVFGAYILGNIILHQMTHRGTIKKMILMGSCIAGISLIATLVLSLSINVSYLWLMPGLISYFLGAGIISAPLGRFILFSTQMTKGTASALMSMVSMCIQGLGIEVANVMYASHNNRCFAFFCAVVAVIYFIFLRFSVLTYCSPEQSDQRVNAF
jgi:DHA1 family multidrug/chloramphenicol efflux transport protein-like MFS transporter